MMECLQRNFPNQHIKMLYDVSCTLKKHLQVLTAVQLSLKITNHQSFAPGKVS